MWNSEHGERLQNARKRRGWEVSDVAHHAGLAVSTVYDLEHGGRADRPDSQPRHATVAKAIRAVRDAQLAAEWGVDLPDEQETNSSYDPALRRAVIRRHITPAVEALIDAVIEAERELNNERKPV